MHRFLTLALFAVLLVGCATAAPEPTPPSPVSVTLPVPTSTPVPTLAPPPLPAPTAIETRPPDPSQSPTTGSPDLSQALQTCGEEPVCYLDGHFLFQRPIGPLGKQSIERSYPYGSTLGGMLEVHHGVEFYNAQGTPIFAAADGKVVFAGNDKLTLLSWVTGYYGNVVVIEHHFPGLPQTIYTLYAHQYKVDVTTGEEVKAGQPIGQVGATGTARGSHLHFEVRVGNNDYQSNRNPELWLLPLPGTGVLAGRIEDAQGGLVKGKINLQRVENGVLDPLSVASAETYAVQTHPINSDNVLQENFAVGELPTGDYRLSLLYNGSLYEQMVKIEAGRLTLVKLVVK